MLNACRKILYSGLPTVLQRDMCETCMKNGYQVHVRRIFFFICPTDRKDGFLWTFPLWLKFELVCNQFAGCQITLPMEIFSLRMWVSDLIKVKTAQSFQDIHDIRWCWLQVTTSSLRRLCIFCGQLVTAVLSVIRTEAEKDTYRTRGIFTPFRSGGHGHEAQRGCS